MRAITNSRRLSLTDYVCARSHFPIVPQQTIVEKLVRSCPDIDKVYLLVREKKGHNVFERIADVMKSPIFSCFFDTPEGRKKLEDKLIPIKGDITLSRFGVSAEDMAILSERVSIVFNSAATIRFSEPIEIAVRNNVLSVKHLMEFCDELKNLKALIHLSTAYSNCHKKDTIHEIFYEPPITAEQLNAGLIELRRQQDALFVYPSLKRSADAYDSNRQPLRDACEAQSFYEPRSVKNTELGEQNTHVDLLEQFTDIALKRSNRPNTYTFTKAVSESYLLELVKRRPDRYANTGGIPVAIVRPSIVCSSWREPHAGFVDNFNGATGGVAGLYTGLLRSVPLDHWKKSDIVPVDMVSNHCIAVGWFLCSSTRLIHEKYSLSASEETTTGNESAPARTFDKPESSQATDGKNDKSLRYQKFLKRDNNIYIFNYVSGPRNPVTWGGVTRMIKYTSRHFPTTFAIRDPPNELQIQGKKAWKVFDTICHKLFAYFLDFVQTKILSRELTPNTSAVSMYYKMDSMLQILQPFVRHEWKFEEHNVISLYEQMEPTDKNVFAFNIEDVDWDQYVIDWIIGARILMLKEPATKLPVALRRRAIYRTLKQVFLVLLFAYISYLVIGLWY